MNSFGVTELILRAYNGTISEGASQSIVGLNLKRNEGGTNKLKQCQKFIV